MFDHVVSAIKCGLCSPWHNNKRKNISIIKQNNEIKETYWRLETQTRLEPLPISPCFLFPGLAVIVFTVYVVLVALVAVVVVVVVVDVVNC
jgi:hypothetical protein